MASKSYGWDVRNIAKISPKMVNETWLTENDPLEKYGIDGYQPLESKPNRAAMVKKVYLCMSYTI